jgi:hypothetical protein
MGGNNISISDLSVYQSSLNKISQDLETKTQNINQQTAKAEQKITFINSPSSSNPCNERDELKFKYIARCEENCNKLQVNPDLIQSCTNYCPTNANIIFPACTPQERAALMPSIVGCNINLSQNIEQSLAATQIASSFVDSQMTADIMNKFESQVDKIISQKNKDFNILQSNSSNERTSISQEVRNEVSNAIRSISDNQSSQFVNGVQEVTFLNQGYISCCNNKCDPNIVDCGIVDSFGSKINGCGDININQSTLQNLKTDQTATSVIESIFNSNVVNDLFSKYKFDLTQSNVGVDPWGFMFMLVALVGIFVVAFYFVGRHITEIAVKALPYIFVVVILLLIVVPIIVGTTKNKSDPEPTDPTIIVNSETNIDNTSVSRID